MRFWKSETRTTPRSPGSSSGQRQATGDGQVTQPDHPWVMAARPATLPAGVAAVLVGSASAWSDGVFALLPFIVVLFAVIAIQIGVNYANDLADAHRGADTEARIGPQRAVASGVISCFKDTWS